MSRKNSKGGQKRAANKYPGLHRELHPKTRWEYLDGDYYSGLSDEDKEYMSKFNEEYYGASLAKADAPETWDDDFHNTRKLRKECTDRNNARNRDLYTILHTRGLVEDIKLKDGNASEELNSQLEVDNISKHVNIYHEDIVNELIDSNAELNTEEVDAKDLPPRDRL